MKLLTLILAALLLSALPAIAQQNPPSTPAPQPVFSCMTSALVLRLAGTSNPGTDATCSFNLTQNFLLSSDNILAPGINFQGFFGGARYNVNSLFKKALGKTTISPSMFNPYGHAAFGIVRNVPATGPSVQHYGFMLGGGFDYDMTNSGKFAVGPRVEYLHAPGFGPSAGGVVISANITVLLGSK